MKITTGLFLSLFLLFLTASASAQRDPASMTRLTESQAIATLKAKLVAEANQDRFSGVVLIARHGEPIFHEAYGYSDLDGKVRSTLDTVFRIGSIGKMFTGVAVMQLVEAGTVKLEDPVRKFLPDYPNEVIAGVTVEQLLTHTGGTGDIFGPQFAEHRAALKDLSDYIALYGAREAQFAPGTQHVYSNYGYVLLGRIIEVVSGKSYHEYVREHIFKPAKMDSTDNLAEHQVKGLAVPSTSGTPIRPLSGPGPGRRGPPDPMENKRAAEPAQGPLAAPTLRAATEFLPYRGTSAGGGYSTSGDLLKFALALVEGRLLDAQNTSLVSSGQVATPRPGLRYAYGFEDEKMPDGVRRFGHSGGAPGINATLSIFPTPGYVVIVLANRDPPSAQEIARFISERLPINGRDGS